MGNAKIEYHEDGAPCNVPCDKCGTITWRKELGAKDRFWCGEYRCVNCVEYQESIKLVSPQGNVEYNARFVLGNDGAKSLENGKWYTNQDLANIAGSATFLRDSSQSVEKNVKKWRCERG